MVNAKVSVLSVATLLLVFGGVSQSLWWLAPAYIEQSGFVSLLVALGVAVLLYGGLVFQAERLLLFVHSQVDYPHLWEYVRPFWLNVFILSAVVGGLLLVSHNLITTVWQSSIQVQLFVEQGSFRSFSLLLASQQELLGSLGRQLLVLGYVMVGVLVVSLALSSHLVVVWLTVLLLIGLSLAFVLLFFTQLPALMDFTGLPQEHFSLRQGLVLVVETSVAGMGLIFGFIRWGHQITLRGWLLPMLALFALMMVLQVLLAWQFARFTWVEEVPSSDRLLLHLPFAFSQTGNNWLYWLWFALSSLMSWLKMALILGFIAVVLSRLTKVSVIPTQLMLVLLTGLLASCWLAIGHVGYAKGQDLLTGLFTLVFEGFLSWWYPLHVVLLCMFVLALPADMHARYVWRNSFSLGWLLRASYVPLIGFLLWYCYELWDSSRLTQLGGGG